jgi:hypothetical protein
MRIGVTGHRTLRDSTAWNWVESEIEAILTRAGDPLVGLSCLAAGTDQLFAKAVLRLGGTLEVVLPFEGYGGRFSAEERAAYHELLDRAASRQVLRNHGTDEEGYFDAGKRVVDASELLIAVWDGLPARGMGGTADIVAYALSVKREVLHLNPETRQVGRGAG